MELLLPFTACEGTNPTTCQLSTPVFLRIAKPPLLISVAVSHFNITLLLFVRVAVNDTKVTGNGAQTVECKMNTVLAPFGWVKSKNKSWFAFADGIGPLII